jgi:hypothetical protein
MSVDEWQGNVYRHDGRASMFLQCGNYRLVVFMWKKAYEEARRLGLI